MNPKFVSCFLTLLLAVFGAVQAESTEMSRPTTGPLKVYVTIFIIDVDDINGASQSFDANIHVQYRWRDERLAHKGPKSIVRAVDEIWNPEIQVINQQKIWLTLPEIVKISPEGEVLFHQRAWGSFSQPLKLKDFPFDRQVFSVHLATIDYSPEEIEFVPDKNDKSGMAKELSVADWEITGYSAESRPYKPSPATSPMAGFAFSFEAERKAGYFIIKVIIPLILIVAMSWVVFWIDPIESGTQISVAITTMLTLIAYRFAIDTDLPKISYLTRMDFFILLSTVLVYASLIEVVVTSALAKDDSISQARTIDLWMRWVFPLLFTIVAVKSLFF
jgi:hypothetical protein